MGKRQAYLSVIPFCSSNLIHDECQSSSYSSCYNFCIIYRRRVFLSFTISWGFSSSSSFSSSLMAPFYSFLASFRLAFSSASFSLNYSLSIIYFFLSCLYSLSRNSRMLSLLSPCSWTVPNSIAEHDTANFLLHFFAKSLASISV